MSKTITLRIWNEQEGKVSKTVEIDNVLSVKFETTFNEITFVGNRLEVFIVPDLNDIEFNFDKDKKYVFITVKEAQ